MSATITGIEQKFYPGHPEGEPLIGFDIHYSDGVIYPIGPILLRHELDAILKPAFEKGYEMGLSTSQNQNSKNEHLETESEHSKTVDESD